MASLISSADRLVSFEKDVSNVQIAGMAGKLIEYPFDTVKV